MDRFVFVVIMVEVKLMAMILFGPADTTNFWSFCWNPAAFHIIGSEDSCQAGEGALALEIISMPGDMTTGVNGDIDWRVVGDGGN